MQLLQRTLCAVIAFLFFGACLEAKSLQTSDLPRDGAAGETAAGDALALDPGTAVDDPGQPSGGDDRARVTAGDPGSDGRDASQGDPGSGGTDACSMNPPPCYCFVEEPCEDQDAPRCLDDMTSQHCVTEREKPLCMGWTVPISCNDRLECTDDRCDQTGGVCVNRLQSGWCIEQGRCVSCD